MKNPASELAKKRWDQATPEERAEVGRQMNEARMESMTPEQRSAVAKKAAAARWAKAGAQKADKKTAKNAKKASQKERPL